MSTIAEDIRKLLELLRDPARWTKGAPARDADGHRRSACDERAVCWCMFGGAILVTKDSENKDKRQGELLDFLRKQAKATKGDPAYNIALLNDSSEHADVVKFLEQAVETAR